MNWLYCTMFFGSLPIAIRFIISLSASGEQIPLFALSDFAFFGIMFNIAAITNATNLKRASADLIVTVVSSAIIHIVLLVAVYSVALFPSVNPIVLWVIVSFVLTSSVILSYLTTNRTFLQDVQNALATANAREEIPTIYLSYLDYVEAYNRNGEDLGKNPWEDFTERLAKCGLEYDFEADKIRVKTQKNAEKNRQIMEAE